MNLTIFLKIQILDWNSKLGFPSSEIAEIEIYNLLKDFENCVQLRWGYCWLRAVFLFGFIGRKIQS